MFLWWYCMCILCWVLLNIRLAWRRIVFVCLWWVLAGCWRVVLWMMKMFEVCLKDGELLVMMNVLMCIVCCSCVCIVFVVIFFDGFVCLNWYGCCVMEWCLMMLCVCESVDVRVLVCGMWEMWFLLLLFVMMMLVLVGWVIVCGCECGWYVFSWNWNGILVLFWFRAEMRRRDEERGDDDLIEYIYYNI